MQMDSMGNEPMLTHYLDGTMVQDFGLSQDFFGWIADLEYGAKIESLTDGKFV